MKPSNASFNKCLHPESNTRPPGGYAHVTSDFSARLNLALLWALVRCLGRKISFSVLKNSFCVLRNLLLRTKNLLFGTNFIESEFSQSCFIMHFCSFCVIKYRPTLMKNKVWVYRCCVMYFFLFKHQNTAENDHFYAVNSQVATLVVFTAGM